MTDTLIVNSASVVAVADTAINALVVNEATTLAIEDKTVEIFAIAQQGPAGPVGPSGVSGAQFITVTTDQAIGGHRVVRVTDTGCDYADSSILGHIGTVIGMTLAAYDSSMPAEIYTHGDVQEYSWNWSIGPLYLSTNGQLTQTPPTTGFVQQVATAIASDRIFIEIQIPIEV